MERISGPKVVEGDPHSELFEGDDRGSRPIAVVAQACVKTTQVCGPLVSQVVPEVHADRIKVLQALS
jgi:hypothetical protein